jgi:hypothetical protein
MRVFIAMALFSLFLGDSALAAPKKVAVVKLLRGEVNVLTLGKTTRLKTNDWVEDGAVVKTAEKSFVKLIFVDKSQMNVGPNSEMKIEKFDGKDSGVIDLVKGKIRSQVTKDYLQIQDKDKSKLFIKTPNAVMGIRGTDFMISTNGKNTSAVLFEGEVVFNRLDNRNISASGRLEDIVDRGVRMFPGEFSVVEAARPQPTVPSLLNVQQREKLEKNEGFDTERAPGNTNEDKSAKSVVPAGLSGQVTSNNSEVLKTEVAQVTTVAAEKAPASADPNGYVAGDKVKPTNGSFLHVESGIIIAPGADSVLDANTNTYIPTIATGSVAADGDYVPPKNIMITGDGEIFRLQPGKGGVPEVVPLPVPPPIKPDIAGTPEGPLAPPQVRPDIDPLIPPPPIAPNLQIINQVENTGTMTNATIRARIGN